MNLSKTVPLFILTVLFSVSPALATDISPAPSRVPRATRIEERQEIRQENREDRQEMREEIKETTQEMRQENKDNRLELRRQNATNIANNIVSKLEKRFEYLTKVKDRLQLKIDNLKATHNMTEAQAKLDLYDTTKYATDLAALKAKVATITTTDKPKTVVPALKETTKLVQQDLKDLHQFLVNVLKLIIKAPKIN
jgi:hypothetical protein